MEELQTEHGLVKDTETRQDYAEDPVLERIVLLFLIVFLVALILIPSDWFLKLSMWWNGIR